jgi:hypothetical protein
MTFHKGSILGCLLWRQNQEFSFASPVEQFRLELLAAEQLPLIATGCDHGAP